MAGRPAIVDEVALAPDTVRHFIREQSRRLLDDPHVEELLEVALVDARRLPDVIRPVRARLEALAPR